MRSFEIFLRAATSACSFRIGHATVAAAQGLSDDTISRLGRWSSSAVKKTPLYPNPSNAFMNKVIYF